MTTNADFFAERWKSEQPAFRRVLAALPGDKLAYCPHERSKCAGDLAWQLAQEQAGIAELLTTSQTSWAEKPRPETVDELVAAWDRATAEVEQALASKDESKWSEPADMMAGGKSVWQDTLQNMLWGYLFDMVHHRGQLSTYIRPMGGKVPAIYGPSGDSQ